LLSSYFDHVLKFGMFHDQVLYLIACCVTSIEICFSTPVSSAEALPESPEQLSGAIGQNQFYFIENLGQWDERVLFKAEGQNGLTWRLERDSLTLAISVPDTSTTQLWTQIPRGLGKLAAHAKVTL
jgi:hypothetical protein